MDDPDNDAAMRQLAETVSALFKRLGVAAGPVRDLPTDSDWAFIIKLYSLLEAALNHLLIQHFGDGRLEEAITAMEFGDHRKGKIVFLKALGLVPPSSLSFLKRLGEIRNRLVHRITDLDFDLKAYLEAMPPDKRNALIGTMQQEFPGSDMPKFLSESPRQAFFGVTCIILFQIEDRIRNLRTSTSQDEGHPVEPHLEPPESKATE